MSFKSILFSVSNALNYFEKNGFFAGCNRVYDFASYRLISKEKRLSLLDKRIRHEKRIAFKNKLITNVCSLEECSSFFDLMDDEYSLITDNSVKLTDNALYHLEKYLSANDVDILYGDALLADGNKAVGHLFKPDYSFYLLRNENYIGLPIVCKNSVLKKITSFKSGYDLILQLTDHSNNIGHLDRVVSYNCSFFNDDEKEISSIKASLKRNSIAYESVEYLGNGIFHSELSLDSKPLISIIIPNKDHIDDLDRCVNSILSKTSYDNYEVIVVENNSTENETFKYYEELKKNNRIRILHYEDSFNYSAINNFACRNANGEYLVFLNNDTEVISENWLNEMLSYCMKDEVGAVGAKLYFFDNTIQHAGVIIGLCSLAGHGHRFFSGDSKGYMQRLQCVQEYSAVTAACVMVRRSVYEEIDGFDEEYRVAYNDIDLCLKIRQKGYLVLWTPYAKLYHFEYKSRGMDDTPEKRKRYKQEVDRFQGKWLSIIKRDPYYNRNLTIEDESFGLK